MNNLDAMADKIRIILSGKDEAREKMLPLCRDSIRFSSTAIRSVHRHEFAEAQKHIQSARENLREAEKLLPNAANWVTPALSKTPRKSLARRVSF